MTKGLEFFDIINIIVDYFDANRFLNMQLGKETAYTSERGRERLKNQQSVVFEAFFVVGFCG